MRIRLPGVISDDEACSLAKGVGYLDKSDPRLTGIVRLVLGCAPVDFGGNSYARVEKRPEGCPWHHDTGTKGHMQWCKYSAGILLTPPTLFSGGGFYFIDRPDEPIFHYRDLLVWGGGEENTHRVARNSGDRVALLMFFEGSK